MDIQRGHVQYMQLRRGHGHVAWTWVQPGHGRAVWTSYNIDMYGHGTLVHSIDIDMNIRHGDGREHGDRHGRGGGHTLLLDRRIKSSSYSNFFTDREIG
jgi:hypothetical protein